MSFDIVAKDSGYEICNDDKSLLLTKPELLAVGCKNCIWMLNGQCPHGIVSPGIYGEGFCSELVSWLGLFARDTFSSAVLWEKYHLFLSQLQVHEDYSEFRKLEQECRDLELEGCDPKRLESLEIKRNTLKLWWARLNESVLRSLRHVADRESRKENSEGLSTKISIQQLNVMMKGADRYLEDNSNDS